MRDARLGHRMLERAGDLARDVLHQRAAHRDVEHLHAAADREEGNAAGHRGARQRDLEVRRGQSSAAWNVRAATSPYSAGSTSPPPVSIRPSTRARICSGVSAAGHHLDRLAARAADGLEVVLHRAVLRDRNQRHVSASYIRAGTATPIRSSTRVSCWRKYATAAARHRRTSSRSSLRIWRLVVERVEHLRQPEAVLGEHRKLQRPHHLFDDVVEARGFEDQVPQLVVARSIGVGRRRAAARASIAASSGRDAPAASGRCCWRAPPRTAGTGRFRLRS